MAVVRTACVLLCVVWLYGTARAAEPSRPLVVAHRGLLLHAPENTLANCRACLQLRLGFEFDVQKMSDGQLVCIHDTTVDRTTNKQASIKAQTATLANTGQNKRVFIAGTTVSGHVPENWRKAADGGVDGILTDYPLELAVMLRGR